jgi:hypothetical protein
MDKQSASLPSLKITREEMLYLMHMFKVHGLVGFNREILGKELKAFLQKGDQEKIAEALIAKQLLLGKSRNISEINPDIQSVLDPLFFPDRVLIVARNIADYGNQVFYVMKKGKSLVLHSLPKEREHFIQPVPQSINVFLFLLNWFPISRLPISATKFEIPKDAFIQVQTLAESGKPEEALALLQKKTFESDDVKSFFRSLSEPKISGSIGWISLSDGQARLEDTISVASDGRTGWLISGMKPSAPEEKPLSVRRIGPDFQAIVGDFVERFTGEKLPRQQADASGKFRRYTLSLDEFSMALAAVNCVELSKKLYAAISRDIKREQYADRMNKAQKSLVEHGLCTMTDRGLPVLNEDLAQAVFAVAKSDSMIQIKASGKGQTADTGVYLVHGRFFSAYHNYGEHLQVLEYGKYKDVGSYLETMFPLFCEEKNEQIISSGISINALDNVEKVKSNPQETEKILISDGIANPIARLLANDFSDAEFRATLRRRDPPEDKQNKDEKKNGKKPNMLLLMKSPRRSWIIQFTEPSEKGKATVTDWEGFRKALANLIA